MKNNRADGGDGVLVKILEAAGEYGINKLSEFTKRTYDTIDIP